MANTYTLGFKEGGSDIGSKYISIDWIAENYPGYLRGIGGMNVMGGSIYGALGNYTTTSVSSPVLLASSINDGWSMVAAGDTHSAAIKGGELWVAGKNTNGELGLSNIADVSSWVRVGSSADWFNVSVGTNFTIATKTNGSLWSWGINNAGQLGLGDIINRSSPVQVGSITGWKTISCGATHAAVIDINNYLWVCGSNINGALGVNDTINRSSPTQVGTVSTWSTVSCGNLATYGIRSTGNLYSWGNNANGALGLNTPVNTHASSPTAVGALSTWAKVYAGRAFVYAITTSNWLYAWGANASGQLGFNNTVNRSSPARVGSLADWSAATAAQGPTGAHGLMIKTDGTLWVVGNNDSGQLGLGDTTVRLSLVQLGTLSNWVHTNQLGYTPIAASNTGSLALSNYII